MEGGKRSSIKLGKASRTHATSIVLADRPIPETGHVSIVINVSARIAVSAEEARCKVDRFVHRVISYLMRGEPPNLVVADRVYFLTANSAVRLTAWLPVRLWYWNTGSGLSVTHD